MSHSHRPVRVLHVIDGLAGGGSERWICDLVRLGNPERISQRIVTIHPDLGRFVYSDGLRRLGIYGRPRRGSISRSERAANLAIVGSARKLSPPVHRAARAFWHWSAVFPLAGARIAREMLWTTPDVIHTHTFHAFAAGILLNFFARIPHVHTVPALVSQMEEAGYGWLPSLYRRHGSRVSRFFTAYPSELKREVPAEAVTAIEGVVDVDTMVEPVRNAGRHRTELRQRLAATSNAPIALSVGRLHPSKGHAYVLEALPAVLLKEPELHWVVAGEGTDRASLQLRARALGIDRRVHLLGFVPDPSLLYAGVDLYLRTNIFEADNLSSYQAMAAGLPVVGFRTGAETELIDKVGHGMLVSNRSAEDLAQAIVALLVRPDRGAGLGGIGATYCRQHLDIRMTVEMFTRTYEQLSPQVAPPTMAAASRIGPKDR